MSDKEEAAIAAREPIKVQLKKGKTYFWCTCGLSTNQPFCDGKHKEGSFTPIKIEPDEDKEVWLCTCKQTGKAPICDGSHSKL